MPTKIKSAKTAKKQRIDWRKVFSPTIILCLAACAFCAIMTLVCFLNPGTKAVSVTSPVENMAPLDAITPKDRITQKFTADNDYVSFGFYYANFGNYLQPGTLHISIENSQKEVSDFTYGISGIADNGFLYINYPLKKDETYSVNIHLSDEAQGITFFTTTADNYGALLTINRQPKDSSIIMSFNNETKDTYSAWYYILAITLIMCYIVIKVDRSIYGE